MVEGIALASAVTGRVLLDAATHLIKGVASELDDVKGIEDAGGVLELVIDGVLTVSPLEGSRVVIWIPERKSSPRSSSQFSCAVPDLPGTRSTQADRGMILPACQVYDAGELTWVPAVSVLVVPHMLVNPQHPHACEAGGVSDAACRHGLMWDHTVFHVVASCRANPAMVAPSKRNCRIAQRIARTPRRALGAHTEWFCSVKVAIWQVCSRHIQLRIVPPDPRRDPGPGRVDHLHHHTPVALCDSAHNQGSQPAGCTTQHRAREHLGCELRSSDGSPPNRRADHTDHNDQATQSSRKDETPPEAL